MEFKRIKYETTVLGKLTLVDVIIKVSEDQYINPADDFDFGDAEENAEYLRRFERGELFVGVISVVACLAGIEGSDYLGGCHLRTNNMFNSKFEDDVNEIVYSHNMIGEACRDLLNNINATLNQLGVVS